MKKINSRGFTLIELLVVIAIIGILSSVVLASLNSARMKSRDARRVADLKQLQTALELYYDANQSYPVAGTAATVATALTGISGSYIPSLPADPTGTNQYVYQSMTGTTTTACAASTCQGYVLKATLEDASNAALNNDVDGTVGTVTCADTVAAVAGLPYGTPGYCVRP